MRTGTAVNESHEPELHTWCYHILPYMEQEAAHEIGFTSIARLRTTIVSSYYCPTRRKVQLYINRAKSDYAGNAGTVGSFNANGVLVQTLGMTPDPPGTGSRPTGARLHENPRQVKVSTAQILDGTSNTLLVAESRVHRAWMERGQPATFTAGYSSDNEDCYTCGHPDDVGRQGVNAPAPDLIDPTDDGALCHGRFGSSHPGVFNALLADGSVRNIRFAISLPIFTGLTIRKDGKVVNVSDL